MNEKEERIFEKNVTLTMIFFKKILIIQTFLKPY